MPTPKMPRYGKNALRPNPSTADPDRGALAFAQETIMVGDFGGADASASRVNGLPSTEAPSARGRGKIPPKRSESKPLQRYAHPEDV